MVIIGGNANANVPPPHPPLAPIIPPLAISCPRNLGGEKAADEGGKNIWDEGRKWRTL